MAESFKYSGNVYQPAAGTTEFALTSSDGNEIKYLEKTHISVSKSTDKGETYTTLARPADWDFSADGKKVVLTKGTTAGDYIKVLRTTPYQDRYTTFAQSSMLTSGQLNSGEDFSMYVDQELYDEVNTKVKGALKYQGAIDLTKDNAPNSPQWGWVYVNTGSGKVIQGGDPGWVGIVDDAVKGAEQVIYGVNSEWSIVQTPTSQVGVITVTRLDDKDNPVAVDNTDAQRPVISSSALITVTGSKGVSVDTATDPQRPAISLDGDGSNITKGINLGYTASATQGVVTNTAGTNSTIPFATAANAGLINEAATPGSGTVQYARQVTDAGVASWAKVAVPAGIDLGYTAAADKGTVTNTAGKDATIPFATAANAGLFLEAATPGSGTVQYARQVTDAGVASWAQVVVPAGTIVADTAPDASKTPANTLYWSSKQNKLYINYNDKGTRKWVETSISDSGLRNLQQVCDVGNTTTTGITCGQLTANMVRSENTGTNSVFLGYGTGTKLTSQIWADGSGIFTGIVTSDRPTNTNSSFEAKNAGVLNAKIRCDGTYFGQETAVQPINSERRLKENIIPVDSDVAWETIKNTPYYSYNFIGQERTTYGPMADEVPAEMIVQPMEENEEGVMVARSDDQGPIRSYDNGMLQARLYTALQKALTRIEALEAQLSALQEAN